MKNLMKSLIPSTRDKISAFFSLLFIAVLSAYLSSCSDNATNSQETDDQFIEKIVKPYVETTTRLAVFKRIARTPRPRLNWRLYQVSMLDGQTTQPQIGTDYVEMNKVEVYVNGNLTYTFMGPDFTQNEFTTKYFG